jgi:hypothetical protein
LGPWSWLRTNRASVRCIDSSFECLLRGGRELDEIEIRQVLMDRERPSSPPSKTRQTVRARLRDPTLVAIVVDMIVQLGSIPAPHNETAIALLFALSSLPAAAVECSEGRLGCGVLAQHRRLATAIAIPRLDDTNCPRENCAHALRDPSANLGAS